MTLHQKNAKPRIVSLFVAQAVRLVTLMFPILQFHKAMSVGSVFEATELWDASNKSLSINKLNYEYDKSINLIHSRHQPSSSKLLLTMPSTLATT